MGASLGGRVEGEASSPSRDYSAWYLWRMNDPTSVRLDADARRLRDRQRLIDEVAGLADDEADRAEAAEVAAMMADLRAPGP